MKKIIFPFLLLVLITGSLKAQIIYGSSEMPVPGDTFRISITASTMGIDYTLTGSNYTWNFSTLNPVTQNIDTFVNISSVPAIYQVIFNNPYYPNNRATVAQHQSNSPIPIPQVQIQDVYGFFRNTSSFYALVGYGANISNNNLPIRFNNVDYIYRFPLSPGNNDSCVSDFAVSIPGIGYIGEVKKRKNTVDGWGTLITPFGTFQTIRVKSELSMHDTIFYNSTGYSIDRIETEYKWLANGFGIPVLTVINRQTGTYVEYIDSVRSTILNYKDDMAKNETELYVFPNPCKENISISFSLPKNSLVDLSLFNLQGVKITTLLNSEQIKGFNSHQFNISKLGLSKGIYYLRYTSNSNVMMKKLIIN